MGCNQDIEEYLRSSQAELVQLIRDLCAIPAPSTQEAGRAAFCKDWFEKNGFADVSIDQVNNVCCPYHVTEDNDLVVFMAHTDTVFPDLEPMPLSEQDGRIYSPGVTDDTANLAVLMICARYLVQHHYQSGTGVLFVANACEEGLGNLAGSRAILSAYGSRIRELISLDGADLYSIVNQAVGSHRYQITVRTEGGHSFGDFGNRNAIRCLASIIDTLYSIKVPAEHNSRTTYNVGLISGGTSVNTIAQEATMAYEYRSDSQLCLSRMQDMFEKVMEAYRATGVEIDVKKIGDRPCSGTLDPAAYQALRDRVYRSIQSVLHREPQFRSGSTDCNIPLSMGIPAVCIGVCQGGGCHTREEWLDVGSLLDGCRILMELFQYYFQKPPTA